MNTLIKYFGILVTSVGVITVLLVIFVAVANLIPDCPCTEDHTHKPPIEESIYKFVDNRISDTVKCIMVYIVFSKGKTTGRLEGAKGYVYYRDYADHFLLSNLQPLEFKDSEVEVFHYRLIEWKE